jgi:hypothetical protein
MRTLIALPPTQAGSSALMKRRRFEQPQSFQDRLAAFAQDARDEAEKLPPGIERDNMLRKVSQADTAAHLDDWANSSELLSPK